MDANHDQFGRRGFVRRSFNANALDELVQQEIGQQQAHSPGYGEYNSSYSNSPTPPETTHQQTTQPYAAQLLPTHFPLSPMGMPQSTSAPVSPHYPLASGPDYGFDMSFGGMQAAAMGGGRNGSIDLANFSVPNSRPLPSSIDQQLASLGQRPLPQYSPSQISATVHTQALSPPLRSPTQPHRRKNASTRTSRDEELIGHVLVAKDKFKCSKPECKELTFGRLADLRRHFDQNHSVQREEYFCRQSGCPRSHNPTGGRSRSFGARKDKRDEHERTVHKRASPKARAYSYSPSERL